MPCILPGSLMRLRGDFLGTLVVPFYPFYLGVSLLKQHSRKKRYPDYLGFTGEPDFLEIKGPWPPGVNFVPGWLCQL